MTLASAVFRAIHVNPSNEGVTRATRLVTLRVIPVGDSYKQDAQRRRDSQPVTGGLDVQRVSDCCANACSQRRCTMRDCVVPGPTIAYAFDIRTRESGVRVFECSIPRRIADLSSSAPEALSQIGHHGGRVYRWSSARGNTP